MALRWACVLVVGLGLAMRAYGFAWPLRYQFNDSVKLTFSEMYMFGTDDGPMFMSAGDSYIRLNAHLNIITKLNQTSDVSVVFFAVQYKDSKTAVKYACNSGPIDSFISSHVRTFIPTTFHHQLSPSEAASWVKAPTNAAFYMWTADLRKSFTVTLTGWHNVLIEACSRDFEASLEGTLTFKNPYGFLPGMSYGYIPFEGARMVAFVIFGVFYFLLFIKHRDFLLPLHSAILAVFFIATLEATVWFAAYTHINSTGQPYCCPFPGVVAAGMILEALRSTLSRAVLLCVCLGYGVVRPKLHPTEWVATGVITALYLASTLVDESARIALQANMHGNPRQISIAWDFPVLLFDILFLSWIYLALSSTIRILQELNQTYKLQMYKRLATAIAIFVSLFAVLTLLILLDRVLPWPWQWALAALSSLITVLLVWIQTVLWDALNFGVLATVCLIWRPSDRAKYLSYSSQLPTSDPDEDAWDDDVSGLAKSRVRAGEIELPSSQRDFHSLPSADDDGEFGLEEDN